MGDAREGPYGIREALGKLSRRLRLPDPSKAAAVWGRWEELVGAEIAGHARPSSLREGVLRVRADSPAWAHELGYLREEIQARVNAGLDHPVVTEVRVYMGTPDPAPEGRSARRKGGPRDPATEPRPAPPAAPEEALERARRAWLRGRGNRSEAASGSPPKTRK
jgi:predicted nucleic acid-binding Zn ribbon protein